MRDRRECRRHSGLRLLVDSHIRFASDGNLSCVDLRSGQHRDFPVGRNSVAVKTIGRECFVVDRILGYRCGDGLVGQFDF